MFSLPEYDTVSRLRIACLANILFMAPWMIIKFVYMGHTRDSMGQTCINDSDLIKITLVPAIIDAIMWVAMLIYASILTLIFVLPVKEESKLRLLPAVILAIIQILYGLANTAFEILSIITVSRVDRLCFPNNSDRSLLLATHCLGMLFSSSIGFLSYAYLAWSSDHGEMFRSGCVLTLMIWPITILMSPFILLGSIFNAIRSIISSPLNPIEKEQQNMRVQQTRGRRKV
jgi:hypothetical protein